MVKIHTHIFMYINAILTWTVPGKSSIFNKASDKRTERLVKKMFTLVYDI